jgi:excisionase family DNA binding protein
MSPFLYVTEVALLLRVPISRVYEWSRTRTIPCYRAGKRLTFDREEVLAWFRESQRVENSLSPSAKRGRQVLAASRRGTPHGHRGSHQRTYAGQSRGSDGQAGAVATSLPSAVQASPVDEEER